MMKKYSAGLLVYHLDSHEHFVVLLVHPGGPFWSTKDDGAWSIPKGEYDFSLEEPLAAAKREFEEEVGQPAPSGRYIDLGQFKRRDGKIIKAWAVAGDLDVSSISSNKFEMEWPPHSGNQQLFPEVDRAGWFSLAQARTKLSAGQSVFLSRLIQILKLDIRHY